MKNRLTTFFIFITLFIGLVLSLIQIYAAQDEIIHSQLASYFYLASSVIAFGLLNFQTNISSKIKILNSLLIFLFALFGVLLALICLYSLDNGKLVDTFAGAIFFLSGIIPASYIFVLFKTSNKFLEGE